MTTVSKGFEQYQAEAKRDPFVLPMPSGQPITVSQPSRATMKKLREVNDTDEEAALLMIFGERNGKRLLKATEDEPEQVLQNIVKDVFEHFGLVGADAVGDTSASPN